jgi:hypothetical protein
MEGGFNGGNFMLSVNEIASIFDIHHPISVKNDILNYGNTGFKSLKTQLKWMMRIKSIVIVCVNGRDGLHGGMEHLRDKLRIELEPLGVEPNNIFTRSWNHGDNENQDGQPDIQDLKDKILECNQRPSYLALIGHSYGGWAVAKLSRLLHYNRFNVNFVGLVDPVFGLLNFPDPFDHPNFPEAGDHPKGNVIKNWYQATGIEYVGNLCLGIIAPCYPILGNGISCGYQDVEGAEPIEEFFLKNWDGERETKCCGVIVNDQCIGDTVHIKTTHTSIDDNQWIWRQIYEQISKDIREL